MGSYHHLVLENILAKPFKADKILKIFNRWITDEEIRQVVLEWWNSSVLSIDTNNMEKISSSRRPFDSAETRKQYKFGAASGRTQGENWKYVIRRQLYLGRDSWCRKNYQRLLRLKNYSGNKKKVEYSGSGKGIRTQKISTHWQNQKRARNMIMRLLDALGNSVEDEKGLVAVATSYFRQIFLIHHIQKKLRRP